MSVIIPPVAVRTRRIGGPRRLLAHSSHIAARAIRESLRQPGVEITNVFIPLFFLAVTTGAVANFSNAFGVDNYFVFQLPVAVLQAVAGSASASGIAIVTDMERGYFDKLLLTPASRWALIIGRVTADAVRAIFFSGIMVIVTVVVVVLDSDLSMAGGVLGVFLILLMAGLFGAAYSGIGIFVAMRTGNAQAAQASFLLFFPLLFMAPAFAPKSVFSDWLQTVATINPVTYIMEGMRGLVIEPDVTMLPDGTTLQVGGDLHWAFLSLAGFGAFTLTIAALALRSRARSG